MKRAKAINFRIENKDDYKVSQARMLGGSI